MLGILGGAALGKLVGDAIGRSQPVQNTAKGLVAAKDAFGSNWYNSALEAQQEARDYTAQREDTAIQRRVEDIKAAGLNPWLAINSGSAAGAASAPADAAESSAVGMYKGMAFVLQALGSVTSAYKNITKGTSDLVGSIGKIVASAK